MNSWRMPNGDITEDAEEMADAWKELAKPLEEATGVQLMGFDPGMLFRWKGRTMDLPVGFVQKLNETLKKSD